MNKLVACIVLFSSTLATADTSVVVAKPDDGISLSYLWDGGAIPFFWAPLLGRIGLEHSLDPPEEPMIFATAEGGGNVAEWEIPGAVLPVLGVGAGLAILGSGDASRWYHVKGLGEAMMTSTLIAGVLKLTVGRHRPDWSPENDSPSERMSFPSSHTAQAFAVATYAGLYLRSRVFAKYRGEKAILWYEALTYAGLAAGATAMGAERVIHNRHHVSDVAVGAGLGIASSLAFYWYQNRRFENHIPKTGWRSMVIAPEISAEQKTMGLSFNF